MSHATIQHKSTTTVTRGPSNNIWADCPVLEMIVDPSKGIHFFDDFINFAQHDAAADSGQYDVYIDTGVAIEQQVGDGGTGFGAADGNGVAEVTGNDADNDEGNLTSHGPMIQVSDTAADAKKMWFECRVKKASIADQALGVFAGLSFDDGAGESLAKADAMVDDTGATGAFSYLGFHNDLADGDALNLIVRAEGGAETEIIAGVHTWVADTYVKLGMVYDPDGCEQYGGETTDKIAIFVNGVAQSTFITATQIAAATFPDGEPLGLSLLTKVGATAESKAQMDWWRVAQLR